TYGSNARGPGGTRSTAIRCWRFAVRSTMGHWIRWLCGINSGNEVCKNYLMLPLRGWGFINQQLYLVPHFFQNKPISRLIAPGIQASHLNDDTLGRALDTLYDFGVTALYSLIAATSARRLGLTSTFRHLDTTSFHVHARYT